MRIHLLYSCLLFILINVSNADGQVTNYARLVNPFIGTGGHGHTYPGASMLFGMMQLSPDTRLEGWDGCSGYHYSDSLIYGFSHTHLSGTGIADYCDILVMPFTGPVQWKNSDYASPFSHKNEKAHAGYYEVMLDKHRIHASLTTATRSGMHKYRFDATANEGKILLDLAHRDQVLESSIEVINDYEIRGMRRSKSWASNQVVYFHLVFEKPFTKSEIAVNDSVVSQNNISAKNIKAWFGFDLDAGKELKVKVGISGVSMANAKENLQKEIPAWDFDKVKLQAETAWNKELGKIEVKGGTEDQRTIFYTALYHASLAPNVYTDVNGEYRGTDLQVHEAKDFTNYSVFSLWDTHRALHPLMSVINKTRTRNWIRTFLKQYEQGGMLPVWELSGNETFCMIGYHSVPVIADAWQKGIRDFDSSLALKAMIDYAESSRFGLDQYNRVGFVSNDHEHESVSKTLEYSYDDWCIAQFAGWLGNKPIHDRYMKRSLYYKNLFDPRVGHMRGKVQGFWFSPFNAAEVNNFFTEANAWQYSFAAPHDIEGMIALYGGKKNFTKKLEELFTTNQSLAGREQVDVTGLIGQYAHGNEPSHHMAYLFNYVGENWRTQQLVHKICNEFYTNAPDGLIGNEDCGQMSAWYVFSALGFYPVTPGSGSYALGTPMFDEVNINLENGKVFTIKAKNRGDGNYYVKSVSLNQQEQPGHLLDHHAIEKGGELVFHLTEFPVKRGDKEFLRLPKNLLGGEFVAAPYFDMETNKFKKNISVKMASIQPGAAIYYRDKNAKGTTYTRYTKPFELFNTTTLTFYALNNGQRSFTQEQVFYKVPDDRDIMVISEVHPMYTAGGKDALIDGITGNTNWKTGDWQSYFARDFEAVIDLHQIRPVSYAGIHVLQDVSPWIVYPANVIFEISDDAIHYRPLLSVENKVPKTSEEPAVQWLGGDVQAKGRYIRVRAINGGPLPAWHESAGQPAHLFIDEVLIK